MASRRILHVDLDAFFASVEQALHPELRGRPVVVGGEPGVRGVVASASYQARALGVKTAMPLAQAYRLCPQATFLPGNYRHYKAVSDQFMAILADFTSEVEPFSLDEAWADLTGFEPFYGSARQAAQRIKDRIRGELGITASVGIAGCKVVAKVASDREKPDGLVEVPPGQEAAFLAPLPVRDLPLVGGKTEKRLKQRGIHTIGQLAAQSPQALRSLFGSVGEVLHRLARGEDASPVQLQGAAAKSVSRSTTLAQDTLDRGFLRSLLSYLAERVAAELRATGRQARCAVLKLRYADFQTTSRHRTLVEPTDAQQVLYRSTAQLLEEALAEKRQRVRLIGVGAQDLVERGAQLRLWDPGYLQLHQLNRAVDRLRASYGFLAVQQGRTFWLRGHYPTERAGFVLKTPSLSR